MSALGGSSLGEGVGDLQEEKTGGDQADGVGLKRRNLSDINDETRCKMKAKKLDTK